jgi:hypothetical protein
MTCPAGHVSTTNDFCDQCGLLMGPDHAGEQADEPIRCPFCGECSSTGDRYCEACGADVRESPVTAQMAPDQWEVLITCDREFFEMTAAGDLQFPLIAAETVIRLDSTEVTIGRFSSSRGNHPDIDLSAPPADPGVSHEHAVLSRRPDGSWSITDRGSMNGTYLNDDSERLQAGQSVALAAGDRVHVGAWTTIVLRPTPA